MNLCVLNQELFPCILESVPVTTLLAFTSSCKTFRGMKDACFANNQTIQASAEFDKGHDYEQVMRNSHMRIPMMNLFDTKDRDFNRQKIDNTYKIVSFHSLPIHKIGTVSMKVIKSYCMDMLHKEFGYTPKRTCENALGMLYNIKNQDILPYFNFSFYDIHQLMYHTLARKYRRVQYLLNNIKIVKTSNFLPTLTILMEFVCKQEFLCVKVIMLMLMYKYIHFVLDDNQLHINIKLLNAIMVKIDEFVISIAKIKSFPKYLKQQLKDIMMETKGKTTSHIEQMKTL